MTDAQALLDWYKRHKRSLPWRMNKDPYRVLVSEVMLQQTRVETVLRYYDRFLDRFPTIESLASSPVETVLPLWSGLGYYSRARRLHAAACAVVERGVFPQNYAELILLPGIGAYTAAAVASIAFGEPVAVLDGNVERVAGRLIALEEDPKQKGGRQQLLEVAESLLVEGQAGESNQAMMELGATLCRLKKPDCLGCPLAGGCRGRESGNPESYPPKRRRRSPLKRFQLSLVIREADRLLLVLRGAGEGWMPGLYELPSIDVDETEAQFLRSNGTVGLRDIAARFESQHGGQWSIGSDRCSVRHSITHHAFVIEVRPGEVRFDDDLHDGRNTRLHWIAVDYLSEVATTSMVEKSLAALSRVQIA